MSAFLDRLIARSLGTARLVEPLLPPLFGPPAAPEPAPAAEIAGAVRRKTPELPPAPSVPVVERRDQPPPGSDRERRLPRIVEVERWLAAPVSAPAEPVREAAPAFPANVAVVTVVPNPEPPPHSEPAADRPQSSPAALPEPVEEASARAATPAPAPSQVQVTVQHTTLYDSPRDTARDMPSIEPARPVRAVHAVRPLAAESQPLASAPRPPVQPGPEPPPARVQAPRTVPVAAPRRENPPAAFVPPAGPAPEPIHVTIERIEVHAAPPPARAVERRRETAKPALSLDRYLAARKEGSL